MVVVGLVLLQDLEGLGTSDAFPNRYVFMILCGILTVL